ncbi:MAG: SCO family protein [Verrucomicrobiota bacterium]
MSEEYEQIHTIISFSFTNQENQIISSKTLDGKIYVANFIYTSCGGLCPKMTQNMALVQKAFKDDSEVVLLSHTVTPDIDTSSILKSYAISYGAMPEKWHFLRGSKKEIYQIARTSYFADKDIGFKRDENDFLHTENFILVDHRRRIRGVYNGSLTLDMKRLVQDIETLKEESSLKSISHKR